MAEYFKTLLEVLNQAPLKATGVFTKKNPKLEFFQETGVLFQQT